MNLLDTVTARVVDFLANGRYDGPGVDFEGLRAVVNVVVGRRVVVVVVVVEILGTVCVAVARVGFSVSLTVVVDLRVVVVVVVLISRDVVVVKGA